MAGGIREAVYRDTTGAGGGGNAEQDAAIRALAKYDNANAAVLAGVDKKALVRYNIGRVPYLRAVEKTTRKPEEVLSYKKQEIDCIANAYQTDFYPDGMKILQAIEE